MAWTKMLLRTPTWGQIALEFGLGIMALTFAVLNATRFQDQVAEHGDELIMVAGPAAVGGMAIGIGIGMIRHRAAVRHASEMNASAHA